jgi:hypothetical protein
VAVEALAAVVFPSVALVAVVVVIALRSLVRLPEVELRQRPL